MLAPLLLGALLLISGLDHLGLWVDEGWTAYAVLADDPLEVTEIVAEDVHPPLYFWLLYAWRLVAGESVFALRYLTVLIVLLAAALIYRTGRSLFGAVAGVIAASLFVTHDLILVLGQEARQYPLAQLLAVLTIWTYWRLIQKPTRGRAIAFALSGAALLWTLYWGGFLLAALAIHALICEPRRRWPGRRRWPVLIPAFAAIALLFAPWLPVLIRQITAEIPAGLGHALPPDQRSTYDILAFQLLGRPEVIFGLLAVVGIAGSIRARSLRGLIPTRPSGLVALALIGVVALSIGVNFFYTTLTFRSLSLVIPALALLIAHVLAQFGTAERVVILAALLIHSLVTVSAGPPTHLPWPDVAAFLDSHTTPDERTLIETRFDAYALMYYLDRAGGARYLTTELDRIDAPETFADDLRADLDDVNGLWVMSFSPGADLRPLLADLGYINTGNLSWPTELAQPVDLWRFDRAVGEGAAAFGQRLEIAAYAVAAKADHVTVNLLWRPLIDLDRHYTVSVFLLDADGLPAAQHDSYPFDGRDPTLGWPTNTLHYDGHVLDARALLPGDYALGVKIYTFLDDAFTQIEVIPVDGCDANCDFTILETVTIDGD